MKVKNYHVFSKTTSDGYIPVKGTLVLKNRRVLSPISSRNSQSFPNAIPQSFIYEDFGFRRRADIHDSAGNLIDVRNTICIKEVEILENKTTSLNWHEEYLINKSWWNEQQLKFMFGNHWIQSDFRFWIPVLISSVTLFITGVNTCNSSKKIDKIEDWKNATQTQIEKHENKINMISLSVDTLKKQKTETTKTK